MQKLLTEIAIRSFAPGYHWDSVVPGFGIRVGKRTKTFITVREGRRTTLGSFPALTLAQARIQARKTLSDAPSEADTLRDALADFDRLYGANIEPRTMMDYQRLVKVHFSHLFTRKLDTVTARDISRVLENLAHTPQEANHAHSAITRLFNWCVSTGRIDTTFRLPAPYKKQSRTHVVMMDELKAIWLASLSLDTFGSIIRFLMLTGQRRSEAVGLRNCVIGNTTITWPKTKPGRSHTIPASPIVLEAAREILAFPAPYNSWSKPKIRLDKSSSIVGWTLHDLRRSVATHMAEKLAVPPHVIERILNHTMPGVAGIYNRAAYMAEMTDALTKWQAHLAQHIDSA